MVLKAVGIDDALSMDLDYFELLNDDIFIICSDGLYKDLDESTIATIISDNKDDMVVLSQSLLSSSLDAGGTDNTSIITLKVAQKK